MNSIFNQFSLEGKCVAVTGAGSGLGRAIAEATSEAGALTVCGDIDLASAEATAATIEAGGGSAIPLTVDIIDESSMAAFVDFAAEKTGALDVFFANAGISAHWQRVDKMPLEDWRRGIEVNLTGAFVSAKHAFRRMVPQKSGKLIFTASIWGLVGGLSVPVPDYAAAKGGVVNLTRELAIEAAEHGMTVNAIAPGFFATNIGSDKRPAQELRDRLRSSILEFIPNHRQADPRELKGTAVYLASAASDLVNGTILPLDAGYLAR